MPKPLSQQTGLFTEPRAPRPLPTLDVQADVRYHAAPARSVLNGPAATGMGFWSVNPYVGCAFGCAYCYARDAHRWTAQRAAGAGGDAGGPDGSADAFGDAAPLPPWLAFERRILVKRDAALLLRRALRPGGAPHRAIVERGEPIALGTATDPYQPAERRFGVTRAILEILAEHEGLQVGLITKSALVTRDAALLARIAERSRLSVHVSLISTDRELARRIEPRAPTPEARLRAVRRLREAGVDVAVNCMPVLPGITDRTEQLRALVAAVADAGATALHACALRLRAGSRRRYLPWLAAEFPALAERYRLAYAGGHQPGDAYRDALRARIAALCAERGLPFGAWRTAEERVERRMANWRAPRAGPAAGAGPQLDLGL